MKEKLSTFFTKLFQSLETGKSGYSARKITACVIMILVISAHIAWLKRCYVNEDFSLLAEVLMIDYGMVSVLLGLTTYESIKNKKDEPKP